MMIFEECYTLSNGVKIPKIGLGTWFIPDETVSQAVKDAVKAGIDETLKKMGLDYLDMMIIHSPQPWAEVNQSENRYKEGNRQAWKALEEESHTARF